MRSYNCKIFAEGRGFCILFLKDVSLRPLYPGDSDTEFLLFSPPFLPPRAGRKKSFVFVLMKRNVQLKRRSSLRN